MKKSLHFTALITLTRFVSQIVGPIYNIQPSQPNKGRIESGNVIIAVNFPI